MRRELTFVTIIVVAIVIVLLLPTETNNYPGNGVTCAMDSDCAPSGCSGQVCAHVSEITNIVTTCEWKDEYECLTYATCGCTEGECEWKTTPEYTSCMEGLE